MACNCQKNNVHTVNVQSQNRNFPSPAPVVEPQEIRANFIVWTDALSKDQAPAENFFTSLSAAKQFLMANPTKGWVIVPV